jgi:hypothetical protein
MYYSKKRALVAWIAAAAAVSALGASAMTAQAAPAPVTKGEVTAPAKADPKFAAQERAASTRVKSTKALTRTRLAATSQPSAQVVVQRDGQWGGTNIGNVVHLGVGKWLVEPTATVPPGCVQVASLADSGRVGFIRAYGGVYGPNYVEVDEFATSGYPSDQTFQMLISC